VTGTDLADTPFTRHPWSGAWPTDEYPLDGTRIQWQTRDGTTAEDTIEFVWCGIEPAFKMVGGRTVFPGLDRWRLA
jgi:hypothetical protein